MSQYSSLLWLPVSFLLASCASTKPYAYSEMDVCPSSMTEEQHHSGVVRCRALCSSYARDFAEYATDCKCWCAPNSVQGGGGYRPQPKKKPYSSDPQT